MRRPTVVQLGAALRRSGSTADAPPSMSEAEGCQSTALDSAAGVEVPPLSAAEPGEMFPE